MTLAWLAVAAYAMHILEEYALDWRNWAQNILGLPAEWRDFYVTNYVVVALGIAHLPGVAGNDLPPTLVSFLSD